MLRLDEAITHVAQMKARSFTNQHFGSDLGRSEAKVLSLVYSASEDSIAQELDRDIRRRMSIEIKKYAKRTENKNA